MRSNETGELPGRTGRTLANALVAIGILILRTQAHAGLSIAVSVTLPQPAFIGQSEVPGNLTVTNASSGFEAFFDLLAYGIRFVPACSSDAVPCAASDIDAAVFTIDSVAIGTGIAASDHACDGLMFDVIQPYFFRDELQFVPQLQGLRVIRLGPPGSPTESCRIEFRMAVSALPIEDATVFLPGLQTNQVVQAKATSEINELTVTAESSGQTSVVECNPPGIPPFCFGSRESEVADPVPVALSNEAIFSNPDQPGLRPEVTDSESRTNSSATRLPTTPPSIVTPNPVTPTPTASPRRPS